MAQAGQIDECPNCPGVYKPSEYPVCRECYQQNLRRPAAGQIREQRDQYADESKGWDQQPQPEVTAPTSEAARVIGQARTNLTFHQQECENHETSTIQYLIMPVLAGLGWDIHDPAQVGTEYRPTGNRNVRPDIALMYNGAPVAFIEAKRLDRGYSPDYREQLSKYAECLGDGSTAVLTNGRFWQICSVSGGKPLLRETIDVNRGAAEEVAAKLSDALSKSMLQVDVGNTSRTTGTSQQTAPNREKIRGDLRRYRDGEAERQGMSPYVLTNAIISLIAEQCPTDLRQLREISGVGPATIEQHGDSIIRIIRGR
ncbi:hypothetical protein GBAR_LOCUS17377 [Geodia barretti]|uniref:HRDC domain-containing protein n=1 Tax=Geodia barretti TaxID=519541 RepID=A0AA35SIM6_GEOBA|nr:hypothetical protein GBAR_LOCUS17377 [Geodia barretti]